jgi:hypothetical protein
MCLDGLAVDVHQGPSDRPRLGMSLERRRRENQPMPALYDGSGNPTDDDRRDSPACDVALDQ